MHRTSFSQISCSLARALEAVGDWWSPLILRDLYLGLHRFDDLVQNLGLSRKALTERLRHLEEHGVIERRAYQNRPVRHEYHLTTSGNDLIPALLALTAWGDRHLASPAGPPMLFQHAKCGHVTFAQVCCSHCAEPVAASEVTARPGPGGSVGRGTMLIVELLSKGE